MTTRKEQERIDVVRYMPAKTQHRISSNGKDVYSFRKMTEVGIEFQIAIYYDADESGYCAQLVSPEIESRWKSPHIGHLFADGVICFGGAQMRARKTLREAFAKSCLWAEGMAIMIASRNVGKPCQFPFSANNDDHEARF